MAGGRPMARGGAAGDGGSMTGAGGAPGHAVRPGVARAAAALGSAPVVQRLAGREAALNEAALNAAAVAGTLSDADVAMPRTEQPLAADEVAALSAAAPRLGTPGSRPIADALADGSGRIEGGRVAMPRPAPARGAAGLARMVAGLRPAAVSVEAGAGRYAVRARMNPWIEVVAGVIVNAANGPSNKKPANANWKFVKKGDLTKVGYDPDNLASLVNQAWPAGGGGGAPTGGYTMPSLTFGATPKSSDFHALSATQLPTVPDGHAWRRDTNTNEWTLFRDPTVAPSSPMFDVDEDYGPTNNYNYTASISDAQAPSGRQPLSTLAYIPTSNYTGARSYPMTSDNYEDANGIRWGRGHGVDHAVGSQYTTQNRTNYTPQNRIWNEGARNHLVRTGDHGGGGYYQESYPYAGTPVRTNDGTPIPQRNHFMITDGGGTQQYYDVPNNNGYGSSRSLTQVTPYSQPSGTYPHPKTF